MVEKLPATWRTYSSERNRSYSAVILALNGRDLIVLKSHNQNTHNGKALYAAMKAHAGKSVNVYQLQKYMLEHYAIEVHASYIVRMLKLKPFRLRIANRIITKISIGVARPYNCFEYRIANILNNQWTII